MSHVTLTVRDVTLTTIDKGRSMDPLFVAEIHRDGRHVISSAAFKNPTVALNTMLTIFERVVEGAIAPVTSEIIQPGEPK